MKIKTISIFLVVIGSLFLTSDALASVRYFCDCQVGADPDCVAGDDSLDGLTQESALRTFEKANAVFNGLPSTGDQVLFCQGGSFESDSFLRWVNKNCDRSDYCVIGDYLPYWASGDEDRPLIYNLRNGFGFEDGGSANHEEGYLLKNLQLVGQGNDVGKGIFVYNDADYITIENILIKDFSIGIHVGGANEIDAADPEADKSNDHITISNSEIFDCGSQGILGGGDDFHVIDSLVYNNGFMCGFRGADRANIYCHGAYFSMTNGSIVGNTIYNNSSFAINTHGMDNVLIKDNYIYSNGYDGHGGAFGLAVSHPDTEEIVRNITIEQNVVEDNELGSWFLQTENMTIRNNIFIDNRSVNILLADNGYPHKDVFIYNNTFYNTIGTEIYASSNIDGISIKNNIFHHQSDGDIFYNSSGFSLTNFEMDYNLYYLGKNTPFGLNSLRYDFDQWQGLGFDANSFSNVDPLFENAANHDFHLQANSPAIDVGMTLAYFDNDYDDVKRLQGLSWDVGAFEYNRALMNDYQFDVDASGALNTADALLILRKSLGLDMSETAWQDSTVTGDVNCDSFANSTDAMLLLRYSLGLNVSETEWCG